MGPGKAPAIMAVPTIAGQLILPIPIIMNAIWGLDGLIWVQLVADALNALLAVGGLLTWFAIVNDNGFQTIWRYFSWSNQTLAMIALWVATACLLKEGKYRFGSLMTAFPATFMTAVSLTYLLMAEEGFSLDQTIAYIIGACAAIILFTVYLVALIRKNRVMR